MQKATILGSNIRLSEQSGYVVKVGTGLLLLLVLRRTDGLVDFQALSPLTYRLLERLEAFTTLTGRAQLEALADEASAADMAAFVREGTTMLSQLRDDGVLIGTQRD